MGKARLIYMLLGQHKKTELSCLYVCLSACLRNNFKHKKGILYDKLL